MVAGKRALDAASYRGSMAPETRDAYAARAGEYVALLGSVDAMSPLDRGLIHAWSAGIDGRVVDAGCGPGHWTAFLHESGIDVEGIDPVPAFIQSATGRFPGVRFRVASFSDLTAGGPGSSGDLAGILAWYSLIHLDPADVPAVLAGFAGRLEPGGSLLLGFFSGDTVEPFPHAVTTAYYWPVDAMAEALSRAGFEVRETHTRTDAGARPHAAIIARRARDAASD